MDTSFFTGNFPSHFSLEACDLGSPPYRAEKSRTKSSKTNWTEIVSKTALEGDSQNPFAVDNSGRFTHLRLKIYPDGGVARLRVHGGVVPDSKLIKRPELDLAAVESGGRVIASSDHLLQRAAQSPMPGRGKDMSDGWGTRRRRGPGHDWAVVKLGLPGKIRRIEVDTAHFKGNFPESCSLRSVPHRARRNRERGDKNLPRGRNCCRGQPFVPIGGISFGSCPMWAQFRTSVSTSIPTAGSAGCEFLAGRCARRIN